MTAAVGLVGALGLAQARFGVFSLPGDDVLQDISGWESVGDELTARGLVGKPNTFLFTAQWFDSGQLAFAIRERSPVLCYNYNDARGFAFWSKPEDWMGWDGLLVVPGDDPNPWEVTMVAPYFTRVRLVAEFPMTRGGVPFRRVRVWECKEQKFPFRFTSTSPGD